MRILSLFYMIGLSYGVKMQQLAQVQSRRRQITTSLIFILTKNCGNHRNFKTLAEHLGLTVSEDMMVGQTSEDVSNAIIGAALEIGKSQAEIEAVMS